MKRDEPPELEEGEEPPEVDPEAEQVDEGPSDEELKAALYDVMGCMRDVRKRTEKTDAMFKPLSQVG